MSARELFILGTRGIPATHGGFETFAERLALYLTRRGWNVAVYCQGERGSTELVEDAWHGVTRIIVPVTRKGAVGTVEFDWKSIRDVVKRQPQLVLTLGYNTAVFCTYLRWCGITNIINMDGLEWQRDKWRFHERVWLWLNEWIGCWIADQLIADHPAIAVHLRTRVSRQKIVTIPYGADPIENVGHAPLEEVELRDVRYGLLIARPEPENSVLEMVTAFSRRPRGARLVVLGHYDPSHNYHGDVLRAASKEVLFLGAIYDQSVVRRLRKHAHFYLHGHQVGGTNPSLVEALASGNAVIAHDNVFNHWVAGSEARFFTTEADCDMQISALLADSVTVDAMRVASFRRFNSTFRWDSVLAQYEALLDRHLLDTKCSGPIRPISTRTAPKPDVSFDVHASNANGDRTTVKAADATEVVETKIQ